MILHGLDRPGRRADQTTGDAKPRRLERHRPRRAPSSSDPRPKATVAPDRPRPPDKSTSWARRGIAVRTPSTAPRTDRAGNRAGIEAPTEPRPDRTSVDPTSGAPARRGRAGPRHVRRAEVADDRRPAALDVDPQQRRRAVVRPLQDVHRHVLCGGDVREGLSRYAWIDRATPVTVDDRPNSLDRLPVPGHRRLRLLKVATEVFLMLNCGVSARRLVRRRRGSRGRGIPDAWPLEGRRYYRAHPSRATSTTLATQYLEPVEPERGRAQRSRRCPISTLIRAEAEGRRGRAAPRGPLAAGAMRDGRVHAASCMRSSPTRACSS